MKHTEEGIDYLDGFSGYGGFHEGLKQAGVKFRREYYSEIDKHAIANYSYNFPNSIYVGPIQQVTKSAITRLDLFTFGWPCQDNSIAGNRKGQSEGTRSGLLYEAVKVINRFKPRNFIAENVLGLLSVNEGIDIIESLKLLSYLNESCPQYDIEMQLFNTRWVLPQNRERLYFVGHLRGSGSRQIFPIGEDTRKVQKGILIAGTTIGNECTRLGNRDVVFDPSGIIGALTSTDYKQPKQILVRKPNDKRVVKWRETEDMITGLKADGTPCGEHLCCKKGGTSNTLIKTRPPKIIEDLEEWAIRKATPIECERLQGLPDDWTKYGLYHERHRKDLLFREKNPELWAYHAKAISSENIALRELSNSARYSLCGNGVSVPIIKMIAEKLYSQITTQDVKRYEKKIL